jgi:hypothetical protein
MEHQELFDVARGDIPERHTHLVGVSIAPGGEHAIVLLAANQPPAVELDQTVCHRTGGRWHRGASGTLSSVIYTGDWRAAPLVNGDPLPANVKSVIVRDRDEEHKVPVNDGYFLYVAWKKDVQGDDTTDPPTPELVRLVE